MENGPWQVDNGKSRGYMGMTRRERYERDQENEKVKAKARAAAKRQADPEAVNAAKRAYYAANRQRVLEQNAAWRAANREHVNATNRAYKQANRGKVYAAVARRNLGKRSVPTDVFTYDEIFARDGWVCQLCGRRVNPALRRPHPRAAELDHIIPLAAGGDNRRNNVQLSHGDCNRRKGTKPAGEQLRLVG